MRFSLIAAVVAVAPAFALANHGQPPRRTRPAVELRLLDPPCRSLVQLPLDARIATPTYAAHISAASCMAIIRTRALVLKPGPAAVDALNAAVQPSLRLLQIVIDTGDVRARILAEHAKADLYAGLVVKLLATVPPISPVTTGQPLIDHDRRVAALDRMAQPWRDRAADAYRATTQLGAAIPDIVSRDPVLAFAVSDSQFERSTAIARR
jgi:hypothetical protein